MGSESRAALAPTDYDRAYFLTDCGGFREYLATGGEVLEPRLEHLLTVAGIQPGERVLDLGCGRGEVAVQAARRGARVVALDFSPDALELARALAARQAPAVRDRLHVLRADANYLPFADRTFGRAILSDLVEHLHPWELRRLARELARVLRPEGRLIVHTFPNRWYYAVGYRVRRLGARLAGRRLPADPRSAYERRLHVNEQGPFGLLRALAPEFRGAVWLEAAGQARAPWRRALSPALPGDLFGCNDIWLIAQPRAGDRGDTRPSLLGLGRRLADQIRFGRPEAPRLPWPPALAAAPEDAAYFGAGWHAIEPGPPPFRWSRDRATLFLGAAPGKRLQLELAAPRPGGRAAALTLRLGGASLTLPAPTDWQVVSVPLPDARRGASALEIRVSPTWVPAAGGEPADHRRLGVALRRIWWE